MSVSCDSLAAGGTSDCSGVAESRPQPLLLCGLYVHRPLFNTFKTRVVRNSFHFLWPCRDTAVHVCHVRTLPVSNKLGLG